MGKIIEIKSFKTSDSRLFSTLIEASEHQEEINFKEWYENGNELLGNYEGSRVKCVDMIEWLKENKFKLLKLLGV